MKINFSDGAWREVELYLKQRLETERSKNDSPSLDLAQTQLIRGRISMIKDLLDLPRHREIEVAAQTQQSEPEY